MKMMLSRFSDAVGLCPPFLSCRRLWEVARSFACDQGDGFKQLLPITPGFVRADGDDSEITKKKEHEKAGIGLQKHDSAPVK